MSIVFYGLYRFFLGCEHVFAGWLKRKSSKSLNALRGAFRIIKCFTRSPTFPCLTDPSSQFATRHLSDDKGVWTGLEYDSRRIILYIHGGTYTHGKIDYFLPYADQLAIQTNSVVFTARYRLAPEASIEDMLTDLTRAVYHIQTRFPDRLIYLIGDGAGGGLCFHLMHQFRSDCPFVKCMVYSPLFNLACDGISMTFNNKIDARLCASVVQRCCKKVKHNMSNVWNLEWSAFPPVRVVVSDDEVLFDDGVRVYYFLHQSVLTIYQNLFHGFQHFWQVVPEAQEEFNHIIQFFDTLT